MTHTTDNTTMPSWAEHNLHQRIKAKEKAIATTKPTEPTIDDIEQEITNIFITIDNYGTAEEARVDIRKLIANQVKEARSDLVETICDIEATREAEGKDFISYKAFKRIKSLAGLDNG